MPIDLARAQDAVSLLLAAIGAPHDEHTADTPRRVAKAWLTMAGGYDTDPTEHLAVTFPVEGDPGLVIVTGIEVRSTCAHHLLPITGTATVAYRPSRTGRVVGLSKLNRLVDGFARRLQVQEQLGSQVANALQEALAPVGAACLITADHGCMTIRGVQQSGTLTTTAAVTGAWQLPRGDDMELVRAEHFRSR